MIDNKIVNQVIEATVIERIRFIEIILQSLKKEIKEEKVRRERKSKRFKVRQFGLGGEVHVDRDELYSERI
jgi:hypothetical protein